MAKPTNETVQETTAEVVVQEKQEVSTEVVTRKGFENVDQESITMPRAKLLQSTSPEVDDDDYEFKAGNIIHSLIMEALPSKFTPIMFLPDSNILFVPRNDVDKKELTVKVVALTDDMMEGTNIICRAADGKTGNRFGNCAECGLHKFQGNDKPVCTSSINVLVLPQGEAMPVVLQFSNTSKKHGTKFKNMTYFSKGDLYSNAYKLDSMKKQSNGNSWYEMTVKPAGKTTDEDFVLAEEMYNQFKGLMIEVEEDAPVEVVENPTEY